VDTLLDLKGVGKTYHLGREKVRALHDVSLTVKRGEFLSIIGPSGSGKSTLLHLMGLMDKPDHGKILFEQISAVKLTEREIARFRLEKIGFVFQDFNLLEDLDIEDNIALPLLIKSGRNVLSPSEKIKVAAMLEKMALTERRHHKPNQVSGGQKQRAAIGRALIGDPALLLADEPTGNLDQQTGEQISELLVSLCQSSGLTLVIVTHDLKVASRAHRVIELKEGSLCQQAHPKKYLG
jgi:putative ABC transport system ATP-binding protein